MQEGITIDKVCKRVGNQVILKEVSFEAKPGRVTAFLGPNGAGKSSTLRILLGLDTASSGSATLGGKRYRELANPLWKVGASFDGVGAPADRTVYQHLRIVAASNGIPRTRITDVLTTTDMTHRINAMIGTLSLGEGQRLGIASALMGYPQFLILDEPTNGLDPSGIRWFREFIKAQAKHGKTVLLSSHILSEVEAVTDDVVIIHRGAVIAKGELHEVKKDLPSLEEVFFHLTDGGRA